jgi:hypothetical protein
MDGGASPRQRHLTSRLGRIAPSQRALRIVPPVYSISHQRKGNHSFNLYLESFRTVASTRPSFYGLSLFSSIPSSARPSFSRRLSGVALHVPPTLDLLCNHPRARISPSHQGLRATRQQEARRHPFNPCRILLLRYPHARWHRALKTKEAGS